MRYTINEDGSVIVPRQNRARTSAWTETIPPSDEETAAAVLDAEALQALQAAWQKLSDADIAAWHASNTDYVLARPAKEEPPTDAERLAAIEDAVLSGNAADMQRVRDNVEKLRGSTQQRG